MNSEKTENAMPPADMQILARESRREKSKRQQYKKFHSFQREQVQQALRKKSCRSATKEAKRLFLKMKNNYEIIESVNLGFVEEIIWL